MPIITKPATIQKGIAAEISLDKSALAAVASVAANAYYSDSANWKEVFIYYKSSTGNQREILKFNATVTSPTANFLVSNKALDIFEVQKIVIVDFDAGNITIPRSQLTTADFDVDMTPAPAAGISFQLNSGHDTVSPLINPTYLAKTTNEGYLAVALSNVSIGSLTSGISNFDITFNLSGFSFSDVGNGTDMGIFFTDVSPEFLNIGHLLADWQSSTARATVYGAQPDGYFGTRIPIYDVPYLTNVSGQLQGTSVPLTTVRVKQSGSQVQHYLNGNLVMTQDVSASTVSKLYMYPFVRGIRLHTVESVTVE